MSNLQFSVIVPVFNRPQEVHELLESLACQTKRNFEVIIVEDGSTLPCKNIVDQYGDKLAIQYIYKPNSGPGPSRNIGYQHAKGDFFAAFDSDCILPPTYFEVVEKGLKELQLDAWGGPDKASNEFTVRQRAMAYTMSSILTTGGIRGGKKRVGWFQPRSFNMGISRQVFESTNGFKFDRFAEDIEFSIRIKRMGFRIGLISEAFVYHKRRSTFSEFYRQVYNFGKGRALVGKVYPEEVKLTHWFPTLFMLGIVFMMLILIFSQALFFFFFTGFLIYVFAIFLHALVVNKNLTVAMLTIPAALLQFVGYGFGFLCERLSNYFSKT